MTKGRLEAFSDGVIAIIITIMVLELRPPHGASLEDQRRLVGHRPHRAAHLVSLPRERFLDALYKETTDVLAEEPARRLD